MPALLEEPSPRTMGPRNALLGCVALISLEILAMLRFGWESGEVWLGDPSYV